MGAKKTNDKIVECIESPANIREEDKRTELRKIFNKYIYAIGRENWSEKHWKK